MLVVDTGPLLAAAEAAYLIGRRISPAAEARFFQSISAGDLNIENLTADDLDRIADLVDKYTGLPLGGMDASLMALAERLDQCTIATLDHRHFGVVRPSHTHSFTIVPL